MRGVPHDVRMQIDYLQKTGLRLLLGCGALLCLANCAGIQSKDQDFLSSYSGFEKSSFLDDAVVYKGNLLKIDKYDSVYIEDLRVLPPPKADNKKITQEELQKLATTFDQTMRDELAKDYKVVSQPGPGTVSFRAAVTDLQPGDPFWFTVGHAPFVSYASTAAWAVTGNNLGSGYATMEAEVLDSVTRERIYAVIDKNTGSQLELIEGLSRWGHVERAFRAWAKKFRETFRKTREAEESAE